MSSISSLMIGIVLESRAHHAVASISLPWSIVDRLFEGSEHTNFLLGACA